MATLDALITAKRRKPVALVTIGGGPDARPPTSFKVPNQSGAIALAQMFGQPISGGSVKVVNAPFEPLIGMSVSIQWGYQDTALIQAFTGYITDVSEESYPHRFTLQIKDTLWRADYPLQAEEVNLSPTWTPPTTNDPTAPLPMGPGIPAKDVITQLLRDFGGIDRLGIPELPWQMGNLSPITF